MIKRKYLIVAFIVLVAIAIVAAIGANSYDADKNYTIDTLATSSTQSEIVDCLDNTQPQEETTSVPETSSSPQAEESVVADVQLTYSDDDLFYLAAAVCREAGGASEEVQLLVANVVINRVNSPIYPDTIYDVLTDYKQYGVMWKYGVSFPKWADEETIDHCYSIARRILSGERYCPDNVLFQAEFEQGAGIYKQFDGYYFCYYE